jgi:hypothetical protein
VLNVLVVVVASLIVAIAVAVVLGSHRWNSETKELRARLAAARLPVQPQTVAFRELEGLPEPVRRFFRVALADGQPMVTEVRVRHGGTFNMGEADDQWKPFTSDQRVVARRPGFDWDGRIVMLPGLSIRVHDAYIAGDGLIHASLLGLFSLAREHGTIDMARGELMRFLAEATWYPTVLLPSQGVRWESVDDRRAYATLTEGNISVTMLFTFNESGLIETVRAESRGRMVSGAMVPTPWEGRFWNYDERDCMRVPLDGEVAWLLPAGAKPYWRGHISEIVYEFAR